jgi:phosphoserine aminotransferase
MNFNAGPAALPLAALERARDELTDLGGTGMSVIEHSHRGKDYEAVHDEAIALVRELAAVPETHDVLFLQGGASQQFSQVPLNFVPAGASADYVVTGGWSEKAVSEAKCVAAMGSGAIRVAATTGEGSGKDKQYKRVPLPSEIPVDPKAAFLHITTNETIHGVEFVEDAQLPSPPVPLVADMSSDFLWRKPDVARFAFIYAGAQKNIGPSGLVVVIARKDFLERGRKDLPKIFQYRAHAEARSLLNTPPTFSIYLVRNVLAHAKAQGGLAAQEKRNREKAAALYAAIDARPDFFRCPVERASRSVMNVVFRLPSEALEEKFLAEAKKRRMIGMKGHRSVGGIRVSIYNAAEPAWVQALVGFMDEFARASG